ncbi:MAG: aspartyl protease family protein [Chthoniobacterales bacterium]
MFNLKSSSARWAALLIVALVLPVSAAPVATVLPAGSRALQFQMLPLLRSRQDHLLVRATINGKPALLCVDTGTPFSAIAINRVAYFGLTQIRPGSDLPMRLRVNDSFNALTIARSLQLGSLNLIDEPMVALDLEGSSRAAKEMGEEAIDGVLGADILFPTQAVLDCRAQTLILKLDPSVRGTAPGLDFTGYSRVPMRVSAGRNLYVDGKFNGRPAKLMVDTGSSGTLLHQPFVRRMKIPLYQSGVISAFVNMRESGVQFATIARFSVGSVNLRSKRVGVVDLGGLVTGGLLGSSPPVAGLLGAEILRRHNGIIDFGTKTLYLKQ